MSDAFETAAVGDRILMFKQPMSDETFIEVAPDGSSLMVVHAPPSEESQATFQVARTNLEGEGDTIYHRTYRYTPCPLSPEVVDSIYRAHAGEGPTPKAIEAIKKVVRLPPAHPPISAAVLGPNGAVWLQREAGSVNWLVLDPDGQIRAAVRAPAGLDLLAVDGSAVWGVVQDELDVPYVVRYRVQRASGR